jgi:hypothetical protein
MAAKYAKKTILFTIILASLWAGSNIVYRYLVESRDAFYTQWFLLEQGNYNTVILGDSHVSYGIDQAQLPDSVFNFAYPGDQFEDMHLKTRYLLRNKPEIDYYLIQADGHNFYTGLTSLGDPRYLRFVADSTFQSNQQLNDWQLAKQQFHSWFPLSREANRRRFEQVLMKDLQKVLLNKEWTPGFYYQLDQGNHMYWEYHQGDLAQKSESKVQELAQQKAYDLHRLDHRIMPDAVHQFQEMVDIVRDHSKHITLFTMPVSKPYWTIRAEHTQETVDSVLKSTPPIYRLDTLYQNRLKYFADPSHLNRTGQQIFTATFIKNVLK